MAERSTEIGGEDSTSDQLSQILSLSDGNRRLRGELPYGRVLSLPILNTSLPSSARHIFHRRIHVGEEGIQPHYPSLSQAQRDSDDDSFQIDSFPGISRTTSIWSATKEPEPGKLNSGIRHTGMSNPPTQDLSEVTIQVSEVQSRISTESATGSEDGSGSDGDQDSAPNEVSGGHESQRKKSFFWGQVSSMVPSPIGSKLSQGTRLNQISSLHRAGEIQGIRRHSDDENPKSARRIRHMRKKVSVTSQEGRKKTNQEDLALAIIEGNLLKVEEIVDAYTTLYGSSGFDSLMLYRYNIDPRTLVISVWLAHDGHRPRGAKPGEVGGSTSVGWNDHDAMFRGLSCLHLATAFDQEQVMAYFLRYGTRIVQLTTTPSGQSLVHTSAWFGTLAPLNMLIQYGGDVNALNERRLTPLHLAALKGHRQCVKALIRSGAHLELQDERGNTPLHAAVLAGHYDCALELVNYDVDVNRTNFDNGAPLHYASSVALVTLLLIHGADPNICISEGSSPGKTVFNLFLEKMPEGCNEILSKFLTSNGKSLGAIDLEIKYDFNLIYQESIRHPQGAEIALLSNVVRVDQRDILKHPVTECFLHMKWLLLRNYFRLYIGAYTFFLVSFTILVFMQYSPVLANWDSDLRSSISFVCFIISATAVGLLILKNVYLILYNFREYIRTVQNFLELIMVCFCAVFLGLYFALGVTDVTVHFSAVSLFATWFNLTLLIGKLPFAGIYINMIVGITQDLLKFLFLYTSTIVAFGLCFHIIGHHHEHFEDPLSSILCMLAMMVGEFNFGDIFLNSKIRYPGTTQVMFVLFLLLVSIIIMNLLVGLAISNITAQFQSAGVYRLKMTVLLIQMIEDVILFLSKIVPCCFQESRLFNHLQFQRKLDLESAKCQDTCVYLYPNQSKTLVYVLDAQGNRRLAGFNLPPWILDNTFKLLSRDNESTASALQANSDRKRQDDRLSKLVHDVFSLKKDVSAMRSDLQTIASSLRKVHSQEHA